MPATGRLWPSDNDHGDVGDDGENCEDHEDGEVMCNHDVGDDDQEALSGVAAEARLRISTVPIYQPARNVTLLASI